MRSHLQDFHSSNDWYSLEYPRLWEMEVVENIPCFFNPLDGSGALQLFSAQLSTHQDQLPKELEKFNFLKGKNLTQKMSIFLNSRSILSDTDKLKVYVNEDQAHFIPYEFHEGGHFFTVCMFQKDSIFILAIYNSAGTPPQEEADTVGKILKSIKIKDHNIKNA